MVWASRLRNVSHFQSVAVGSGSLDLFLWTKTCSQDIGWSSDGCTLKARTPKQVSQSGDISYKHFLTDSQIMCNMGTSRS